MLLLAVSLDRFKQAHRGIEPQAKQGKKTSSWDRIKRLALAGAMLAGAFAAAVAQTAFGPANAKETYYWVSNKANLPLFVQYDYVGMKKVADELNVKVRVAGPTDFDLPASSPRWIRSAPRSRQASRWSAVGSVADGIGQQMHRHGRADGRR